MKITALVLVAVALAPAAAAAQDFRWHGAMAKGKTLEVRGINGPIRATRASGAEAEVIATRKARKSDPASVEIKTVEEGGNVTICAVYPARRGHRANECRPGGGNDGDTRDNDVEVTFEVRVPAGIEFRGATVNGDVTARDLDSEASLATVNGDVDVETGGVAEGTTVNGSITARLGRADWERSLKFTTVNGGIRVSLPGGANTEVEATTVNGTVESDFPITVQGRIHSGSLRGRIGEGGRSLDLTTVNGSIRLERRT
jgi:DUF4097 and DUF4098 domain-containing protein YvlB